MILLFEAFSKLLESKEILKDAGLQYAADNLYSYYAWPTTKYTKDDFARAVASAKVTKDLDSVIVTVFSKFYQNRADDSDFLLRDAITSNYYKTNAIQQVSTANGLVCLSKSSNRDLYKLVFIKNQNKTYLDLSADYITSIFEISIAKSDLKSFETLLLGLVKYDTKNIEENFAHIYQTFSKNPKSQNAKNYIAIELDDAIQKIQKSKETVANRKKFVDDY